MNLKPEEVAIGKDNFYATIGSDAFTRRNFMKGAAAAGVLSGAGLGSLYYGYTKIDGNPLRVGFIGTGDEGGVLLGAINPDYLQVVAIADIRPYNVRRAFHGDHSTDTALKARKGLMTIYKWGSEDEARKNVKVYDQDYHDLLNDKNVEAVVIALPLHLHAPVAIEAMRAGKHVLTEKLMGHSVHECKEMGRVAKETDKILAVGHQRHYSILYANAVDTIASGLIGDIHHIRAQWHRENKPGKDSWQPLLPKEAVDRMTKLQNDLDEKKVESRLIESVKKEIEQLTLQAMDQVVDAEKYGYRQITLSSMDPPRPAIEELIRWRLWNRTGGGLMAELGSHQLDAAGIFISGLREDRQKALPLNVSAIGQRNIFPLDRECEDHVYCMFEFPGPKFEKDANNKIGVTYSSINGNGFGGYGETVLGTGGTLILEREQEVMLFKNSSTSTNVTLKAKKGGGPALDTTESKDTAAVAKGKDVLGPVSRGYTEEMEHWAWCIRNPSPEHLPHCHPKVALGDAVIALTTNVAIRENRRIEFDPAWFDIDNDATPEGVKPDLSRYT